MTSPYWTIFENAAMPQRIVFLTFIALTLLGAATVVFGGFKAAAPFSGLMKALGFLCPCVGMLCAALNGFHMMQTTLRLPFEPTLQILAPGLAEMSALVVTGALAGLAATAAHGRLSARDRQDARA